MIKLIISFLALFCIAFSCSEQTEKTDVTEFSKQIVESIDSIISNEIETKNLPGVVVGVWIPGEGEYVKAFGTANLETGKKRKLTDQFRIASITKTFAGLRILQLHDADSLNIDDSLSKYFPDFPRGNSIKIRNLLNMNSGISDFAGHEFLEEWYDDPMMPFTMEEAVAMSAKDSAEFYTPGDSVKYCNVNYTILGLIIEKIMGNPVGEEIENHIMQPLGMENSLYPYETALPGELRGYSWNNTTNEFEDKTELNPVVANTGGAIISNLYDLKRYVKALYTGELISKETHEKQIITIPMQGTPEWIQYGLGIINMGSFYGHNGTIFGFSTEIYYLPEKDAVIVINVNRLDVDDQSKSGPLFFKIAKLLFPDYVKW
ncbi:serine hydrolase domain-containing protein [Bacteroidota bacterium]